MVDVPAPRAGEPRQSALDAALKSGLVPVDHRFLPVFGEPDASAVVGRARVLGAQTPRPKEPENHAVHEQGAELLHEVE